MACQDCDNSNITTLQTGPQGPTGPTGPAPDIDGTSTSVITVGTGAKTFTTQSGIAWTTGQRLRAANNDSSKIMDGEVTSYSATTLVLNVDYTEGSGSDLFWNISIIGERGPAGPTGATGGTGATGNDGINAFGEVVTVTPLGGGSYTINMTSPDYGDWAAVGQALFLDNSCGYYQVTVVIPGTGLTISDLGYPGNTPANIAAGVKVSPAGFRGATGATGSTGATGATGSTGATGATGPMPKFTNNKLSGAVPIPSATNTTVFASASTSGQLQVMATFAFSNVTAPITITITPRINGSDVTASAYSFNSATAVGGNYYTTASFTDVLTITAGQSFEIKVTADTYANTLSLDFWSLNYYIG